jgi:chaperonin GroEL
MQAKEYTNHYKNDARDVLIEGVNQLADMVNVTLGAGGRLVAIENTFKEPYLTKDGVTVAKKIKIKPPYHLGAAMLRRAAERLGNEFGDGTSTVTCMTQSLVNSGRDLILKKGLNTRQLVYDLEQKKGLVLENLRHQKKDLTDDVRPEHIVLTSTNNDTEITTTIMNAYASVGSEGLILIEESKSMDTLVQLTSGYAYDRGYVSSQFIKDNASLSITMNDVKFLLCDRKIERTEQVKDIILQIGMSNRMNKTNTSLVIIADDFDPQVLAMLIMTNRNYDGLGICCIKAPSYGENRFFMLEDIAALTGATVISQNNGLSLGDLRYEDLGSAGQVFISSEQFIIKEPSLDEERVNKRIEHANAQYHNDSIILWEREQARKRMAKLMSKTAIIMVGGTSDLDVKEKMDRYDDAIKALMVSLKGGIVAGGGVAMLQSRLQEKENDWAATMLNKALYAPFKQIMDNAGVMPKERVSVLEAIRSGKFYTLKMKVNRENDVCDLSSNCKYISPFLAISDSLRDTQCIDPYLVTEACVNTSVAIATSILLTAGIVQSEVALSNQQLQLAEEIDMING